MAGLEWRRWLALAGLVAALTGGAAARAQNLPPEQCKTLAEEHAALVKAGVPDTLKKGAAWGKANLAADKLKEVERYIGLEEQLLFHCGLATARKLPGAGAEEEGDAAQGEAAATPSPAPPAPTRKPARKAKPKTAAAASEAEPPPPPVPRAKPKPSAKPKADDAYHPPAKAAEPAEPEKASQP